MGSTTGVLPDPTADLHWSEFRGAIHDVFAENARKHPDRIAVVETASSTVPRREFAYRHIFEASCQLAHKLVDSGIERGDVVMIYAHRSVDLVVAIMGTLMSGATFSVLDPLYPADRQVIYLDVSQPRALVNLARATDEAGQLADAVRAFINDKLSLKTEIPALRLLDDGTLIGGELEGKDCLSDQLPKKADVPGVLVGPDSTPTLSFTSGSEGRPKGVKGRHYSLTYYFDWMAEQFNFNGSEEKFTMLSGIAHDPIQRDIFTPLFLGGQILVPPKEDIQHEKLAEWMRREGATVTTLTPAMGQILVGNATAQFPALYHAFYVGDILIKRDCRRLQELAPNCFIVNMFGTTETQRAVSYYEIPSRNKNPKFLESLGEVIPAGQGMKDVQLLIVDRENKNRLCDVGETGEIYVRAGGLAEGYLGLDGLTKEKFVSNWFLDPQSWVDEDIRKVESSQAPEPWRKFYRGPRDRMYKSGDLGVRDEDGNVRCTGRADNQVKIRGFRIELGEIDAHLTSHPLVRENVTLLRRDANEEPTLVSYVVPEIPRWLDWVRSKEKDMGLTVPDADQSMVATLKKFKSLRDDVRNHLKAKLPVYAVPGIIVPLYRMPLNPNGKVDKPALPFPEPEELAAAAPRRPSYTRDALSPTEQKTATVWADVIKKISAKMIGPDDSFFDIGGHSILAQNMLSTVRKQFGVDVRMKAIFDYPTLRQFAAEIDRAQDPSGLRLDLAEDIKEFGAKDEDYSADARELVEKLPSYFPAATLDDQQEQTIFLTGSTGFLGAYILKDLLQRDLTAKVIAHVRAKDPESGLERIFQTCNAYGIWQEDWSERLEVVTGDLTRPNIGVNDQTWEKLRQEVDVIIHNGAQVHWIHPYSTLRRPNVLSTISLLDLCTSSKPKAFGFVSSTSVLDSDHYVRLSEKIVAAGGPGINEADSLEGSRKGLGTGYGQSKWASEYIIREAGYRGLRGAVIRPGYITGDERTGTTNTDDFLVRLLKGCAQVQARPRIDNTINMVPVGHVARVIVASTLHPPAEPLGVSQITSHPRLRFYEFLHALETYGYEAPECSYKEWNTKFEQYVESTEAQGREDHALLPLYDMVTSDLPGNTKAPELNDANATRALRSDAPITREDWSSGGKVTEKTVGTYLAYLVAIGFIAPPVEGKGRPLPKIALSDEQRHAMKSVGGRGGTA